MNRNILPEDFNMNILLPGAAWLLVSAFMGYAVVARMETNALTVILFIVVMLVAFIIPMTVYMEYRMLVAKWLVKKAEQKKQITLFLSADERTSPNNYDVTAQMFTSDETTVSNLLPPDFPDVLKGEKSITLLGILHREGFLNDEYRPYKGCNATQMAFIANSIGTICNISYQWKTFGGYWQLPNLRQLLATKDRRGSKMEKEDIIIDLLKRAAEADGEICNTNAYRCWLKSVQS